MGEKSSEKQENRAEGMCGAVLEKKIMCHDYKIKMQLLLLIKLVYLCSTVLGCKRDVVAGCEQANETHGAEFPAALLLTCSFLSNHDDSI